MTPVRAEYEDAVLMRLRDEVMHQVHLNAHLGYQIDPSLPAPEVFERPGWKVLRAPDGAWCLEIPILPSMLGILSTPVADEEMLLRPPKIETEIVRPLVEADVEFLYAPGMKHRYGLGVCVTLRRWVVFHG